MLIKSFNADGVLIEDEIIRCNESVSIGGVTYYVGYLNNTCNDNISDPAQTDYTAYSGAGQTGTRKTVILAGYPANADTIRIDGFNGKAYSTTSQTIYITYLAHEPIKHNINNVTIHAPYELTDGEAITLAAIKYPYFSKIGYVTVNINGSPSADATLTLSNGTETANVTLYAAQTCYTVELTAPLKITTSETLTISTTDGNGAYDIQLNLLDA